MSIQIGKSEAGIREEVLKGWSFEAEKERPNVVRIFLSSTFHDFTEERNYLFKEIVPKLEKWCQERGLEFQVSDMRWGIRDTGDNDHDATSMCLKEVEYCQKFSIGPNFVAFLGDRYGFRPLPSSILAEEFDCLLLHTFNQSEHDLLTSWYQLDLNSRPPVYLRKRARTKFSNHQNSNHDYSEEYFQKWRVEQEQKLQEIFYSSAKKAVEAGQIESAYRFVASATEQEIWSGILNRDNPEKEAICFMRTFKDLSIGAGNKKTRKYVDVLNSTDFEVDSMAQEMLSELKTLLIPAKLSKSNIFRYTLELDPENGLNPRLSKHAKYLQELGQAFSSRIIDLTVESLKQIQRVSVQDALYKEVVQHVNFAIQKAQLYCGREKVLEKLFKRLCDTKNKQPIILYGESGVGKTATVAKLIQETWKHVDGPPNVIYRFLGITPASSSIDLLFVSLSHQICELYGLKPPSVRQSDFNQIRPYFYELLGQVSKPESGPLLIIILDSLDQLSPAYGAHLMNWLVDSLPVRIKLLLTVMPNYRNILTRLRARLKPQNFIELTQLANETAVNVLDKLLQQNNRTLQPKQIEAVEKVFKDRQTPLLLHMTVIEASRWHSYTPENQLKLGSTLREAVHVLFERLESRHGKVLVSHALSYLVAAKNGLTEKEMEEILSLDDSVLDDVYQYWAPPSDFEIRIPPLLFVRLKQEMADFIMSRKGDDMTVMGLYHKQFTEVIIQRYLSSVEIRQKIHQNLAEFFLGDWFDHPKPANLRIFGGESRSLGRKVPAQPLRFGGSAAGGRYNLRKLNELPYHLVHAENYQRLKTETLANYTWLQTKIEACDISSVLSDFDLYLQDVQEPDMEISAIKRCIRLSKSTLEYKDNENTLAVEMLARMNNLEEGHSVVRKLLNQARNWCRHLCPDKTLLIPDNQCFMAPTGSLVTTLTGHSAGLVAVCCTEDRKTMVTASKDKTLRIWDLELDAVVHIIEQHSETDQLAICNVQDKLAVLDKLGSLAIYDIKAGNLLHKLEPKELMNTRNLSELKTLNSTTKNSTKEERHQKHSTNAPCCFCSVFDRMLVTTKDRDIFLVDISEEPRVLKRFQTDANVTFARVQGSALLFGVGKNGVVFVNPKELSPLFVTYQKVSEILGAAFTGSDQSTLVSVVNIHKKGSIIIDKIVLNKNKISNSTKKGGGEPVTIFHENPAKFCDFLSGETGCTLAIAGEDRMCVLELPTAHGAGKKFKPIFSSVLPPQRKHSRQQAHLGSVLNADMTYTICFIRLILLGTIYALY